MNISTATETPAASAAGAPGVPTPSLDAADQAWQQWQAERARRASALSTIAADLRAQPSPRAVRAAARRWHNHIAALTNDITNPNQRGGDQ